MRAARSQEAAISESRRPSAGDMVLVRSRRWLVEEVVEGAGLAEQLVKRRIGKRLGHAARTSVISGT